MRYCKKCSYFTKEDNKERCPNCKQYLQKGEPQKSDSVIVIRTGGGIENDRITAALSDAKIPFSLHTAKKQASAEAITGQNNAVTDILVNFGNYDKAYDLLVGIGAIKLENEEIINDDENISDKEKAPEEFEEMGRAKRNIVRIVSVILFILVVFALIQGVDFVSNTIKGMF